MYELATLSLGSAGPTFTGSLHYRQRYVYAFLRVRNANATCIYHKILQQQHNLLNPTSKVNSNLGCLETICKIPVSKTSDHNQYRVSRYHCLPAQHSTRLPVPIHAHGLISRCWSERRKAKPSCQARDTVLPALTATMVPAESFLGRFSV